MDEMEIMSTLENSSVALWVMLIPVFPCITITLAVLFPDYMYKINTINLINFQHFSKTYSNQMTLNIKHKRYSQVEE